ncbi:CRISPR-associated endoribonuclease Cas2 [Gimesia panareensis]|uniref:CRISPR-associated endoribonuclease Cas2 n=1 Tax=Gimesia panareensis TaxID=2527978 RepID=A0A518FW75_9PLAN|nr:CRISPR-associated endonuclease Cas2 [Gimesia panareensis]QDV20615.1 CRISPR-associated endoribonuclease Cas2 [Gimesia panareensis]
MRSVYLISYDICSPKRYRKIYPIMCGHGDAVQYSVFKAELTEMELHSLKELLWPLLNHSEDRVMIVNLGPIEGRGDHCIEFWGDSKVTSQERSAIIL